MSAGGIFLMFSENVEDYYNTVQKEKYIKNKIKLKIHLHLSKKIKLHNLKLEKIYLLQTYIINNKILVPINIISSIYFYVLI